MRRSELERLLATGASLEEIGRRCGKDPSTIRYWLKKFGLNAVHSARHAARGALERNVLEQLVGEGMTTSEIAHATVRSESTVRYWLKRYGLRTRRARQPMPPGPRPRRIERWCLRHGMTEFILENRGYYRCSVCRSERVSARRRHIKAMLVREAGGRCVACGYSRFVGALQFHHLDPAAKSFALSRAGVTRSLTRARAEADKCVLVCANCHAEIEAGVARLPRREDL